MIEWYQNPDLSLAFISERDEDGNMLSGGGEVQDGAVELGTAAKVTAAQKQIEDIQVQSQLAATEQLEADVAALSVEVEARAELQVAAAQALVDANILTPDQAAAFTGGELA